MKRFLAVMVSAVLLLTAMLAPLSVHATEQMFAPAPQIERASHDCIDLVLYPGYEYRINGGSWQASRSFPGLETDTEYTFEQRNTATGAISAPVVFKTQHRGFSSFVNHEKLLQYLAANGTDIEGSKTLAYVLQDDTGADYYFVLGEENGNACFGILYDGSLVSNLFFDIYFELDLSTRYLDVEYDFLLVSGDQLLDQVTGSKEINRSLVLPNYNFQISTGGTYLTKDDVNELLNLGFAMLLEFWDEEMYHNLGFGFKGLGFPVYHDGLGYAACDLQTHYHNGNTETLFKREPGCLTEGSYGYYYCTACGEQTYWWGSRPAKGSHTYDNDCDASCNDCGETRYASHSYAQACSESCSICNEPRENPPAKHTWDDTGLCTLCGKQGRLPGDVTGDGRVNIGDVAKIYAHAKSTALLEGEDLVCADINGDGKINIGDAAKLYGTVKRS